MTKQDLIRTVAEKAGLSQKQAGEAVNAMLDAVVEAVAAGDKVQLVGFGTFESRKHEARQGFNPLTKEAIQIPESVAPAFKAGQKFKDAVNK